LGSNRSVQALGIQAKSIEAFEADFQKEAEGVLNLAMVESDQSRLANISRELWARAAHGRVRPRGARCMIDASGFLEQARLIADESAIERLRVSAKIAALGHLSAWEALFRAVAKTKNARGMLRLNWLTRLVRRSVEPPFGKPLPWACWLRRCWNAAWQPLCPNAF